MERDRPPHAERIAEAITLTSGQSTPLPGPLDETRSATPGPQGPPPSFAIGARIGRYVLLAKLGEGGMGEVFTAFDQELERRVALKVVRSSYLDTHEGHARIEREALALARLSHPNVVQIYDVGAHSGQVFVAMEYIKGDTLKVAQARHDPATRAGRRAILDMYMQAGRGLAAAHAAGLVHRDFKPQNVLVADDGRVRVFDFGLAHADRSAAAKPHQFAASDQGGALNLEITAKGSILGTPAYMAPEQFLAQATDHRADIFAFSVALYAALYREMPFPGATFAELRAAVLDGSPRPAPPGAAVPLWLRAILLRGLARRPDDRPVSIDALLHALAEDPDERARLRWRRLVLALLIALAAWLLGVLALWSWGAWQRGSAERQAGQRLAAALLSYDELIRAGQDTEAERAFTAFVEHPDNRGTAALGRAWLHRARRSQRRGDIEPTIDALATAFTLATAVEDRRVALLSLAQIFRDELRWPALDHALTTLDPGLSAEEAQLRLDAALARRDLDAALAQLAGPSVAARPVLKAIQSVTPTDHRHRGYAVLSDLDGDGRREIVLETNARDRQLTRVLRADLRLTPLATVDLGAGTFRALPARGDGRPGLLISTAPEAEHPAVLSRLDGGHLVELFRWPEGQIRAALSADLDGDGRPEHLIGAGPYTRRLTELVEEADGSWSTRQPAPALDRRRSDVLDLLAGDLDGDRRPELIAALGPWTAFELQLLRRDPASGELTAFTRRRLGNIAGAALVRGPDPASPLGVAVSKTDQYPSSVVFPRDRPYGEPAGLYLFHLQRGELVQTAFSPAPRLAAGESLLDGPPIIGDLDGDGRDEIILCRSVGDARTSVERDNTVILVQGPGGQLLPLTLGDLRPIAALDLDGDGDDELLVSDSRGAEDRVWILGSGSERLPHNLTDPPAPAAWSVADPLLDRPLQRAEQLARMGLPGQAAANLAALARWVFEPQLRARIELRAAQLYESQAADASAAPLYASAARASPGDPRAREGAARSDLRLGHIDAAASHLAAELTAAPDLLAAITALQRGPALAVTFDRPLAPIWRIAQPLALRRDGAQHTLHLDAIVPGELTSAPLRSVGADLALELDLHLTQLEWGSHLSLGLAPEGTQGGGQLSIELTTTGGGNDRVHELGCAYDGLRVVAKLPFDVDDDRQLLGDFKIRAARLGTLGEATCEVLRGDGERLLYRRIPLSPASPAAAPLRLTLASTAHRWSWTEADLRSIHLRGAELDHTEPTDTPPEHLRARRCFIEDDHLGVLAALDDGAPLSPSDRLLALVALARLGRWQEAEHALTELLRDPLAAPILDPHLDALLRTDPQRFGVLIRRPLTPQLARQRLSCAWIRAALADHNPRAYAIAWTGLAERDLDADSFDVLRLHAQSAAALGHHEAAQASFTAALRALDRPYQPCWPGRSPSVERLELHLEIAALALARGDEADARRLLAPELRQGDPDLAERLRARADLRALWDLISQ